MEMLVSAIISAVASVAAALIAAGKVSSDADHRQRVSQMESDHRLEKALLEQKSAQEVSQAKTNEKIEELTREVREHNNFAKRVPLLEEQMKVVNHRIQDLEDI